MEMMEIIMSKNAITVIDQELIDSIQESIERNDGYFDGAKVEELLSMAKDLIEINAELTKREQRQLMIIKSLLMAIEKHHTSVAMQSCSSYELAHEYIDSLKGDSDE